MGLRDAIGGRCFLDTSGINKLVKAVNSDVGEITGQEKIS